MAGMGLAFRPEDMIQMPPVPLAMGGPPPQMYAESPAISERERLSAKNRELSRGLMPVSEESGEAGPSGPSAPPQSGSQSGSRKESRRPSEDSNDSEKVDAIGDLKRQPTRRLQRGRRGSMWTGGQSLVPPLPGLPGPPGQPGQPQYAMPQVLFIPQLDGIQRTQKILDMRLQHLQMQTENIMITSGL